MEVYKILGPIAVVQLWACLLFMIHKWPGNKSLTYSGHAATSKQASVYYFVVFTIHLVLLYLFVSRWFVPTFDLPLAFLNIIRIALLGQLIALLVPSTGGRKTTIHDIAAYCMHMLLMPLSLFVVFGDNFSLVSRVVAALTALYMVFVWIVFSLNKFSNYRLILQTFYGLSFHTVLLVATFVR